MMAQETPYTVLVVDDNERIVKLAADMLNHAGYRVIKAHSAEQAITAFDSCSMEVDLLLTDVLMPGMSGPELAELLQFKKPGLPTLLMTGYAGRYRGADDLIEKPFSMRELHTRVAQALAGAKASRTLRP